MEINRWKLTEGMISEWKGKIEEHIKEIENFCQFENPYLCELDLSQTSLNLITLKKLLKEMGYEEGEFETNGWEMDFWQEFTKYGEIPLMVRGCGMTFELILSGIEE